MASIAAPGALAPTLFEPGVFGRRVEPVRPEPTVEEAARRGRGADARAEAKRGLSSDKTGGEGGPRGGLLSFETMRSLQETPQGDAGASGPASGELTEAEEKQVRELKRQDAEVRAHERAHASAGGVHAGSPSFEFQTGPDGKRYAVGGEVPIDVSPVAGDPEATIAKMTQVKAAANAPAEPSSRDRQVAAQAEAAMAAARREKTAEPAQGETDATAGLSGPETNGLGEIAPEPASNGLSTTVGATPLFPDRPPPPAAARRSPIDLIV